MTRQSTRRGLVLGAGGVLGASWTVGALAAVQEHYGWDPREADVLVGTSAGSVLAAALGSGVDVQSLLDHQQGVLAEGHPMLGYDIDTDGGGATPQRPRLRVGSPRAAAQTVLRPWRMTPMMALSTVLPEGRGSLEPLGRLVDAFVEPGGWAPHPRTWIVAFDYDKGRRTVFGRDGAPRAALRDAVMASCAIPGWYAPVTIGRRRYVDGGVCSSTSIDVVARYAETRGLDEVVVLAPMISLTYDEPRLMAARVERRVRRLATKRALTETRLVSRSGTKVTLLGPGADDLRAIGANLMDPRRRARVLETSLRTTAAALRGGPTRLAG